MSIPSEIRLLVCNGRMPSRDEEEMMVKRGSDAGYVNTSGPLSFVDMGIL
jgi:hypothetical protein